MSRKSYTTDRHEEFLPDNRATLTLPELKQKRKKKYKVSLDSFSLPLHAKSGDITSEHVEEYSTKTERDTEHIESQSPTSPTGLPTSPFGHSDSNRGRGRNRRKKKSKGSHATEVHVGKREVVEKENVTPVSSAKKLKTVGDVVHRFHYVAQGGDSDKQSDDSNIISAHTVQRTYRLPSDFDSVDLSSKTEKDENESILPDWPKINVIKTDVGRRPRKKVYSDSAEEVVEEMVSVNRETKTWDLPENIEELLRSRGIVKSRENGLYSSQQTGSKDDDDQQREVESNFRIGDKGAYRNGEMIVDSEPLESYAPVFQSTVELVPQNKNKKGPKSVVHKYHYQSIGDDSRSQSGTDSDKSGNGTIEARVVDRGYRLPSDFTPVNVTSFSTVDEENSSESLPSNPYAAFAIARKPRIESYSDKSEVTDEMVSLQREGKEFDNLINLDKLLASSLETSSKREEIAEENGLGTINVDSNTSDSVVQEFQQSLEQLPDAQPRTHKRRDPGMVHRIHYQTIEDRTKNGSENDDESFSAQSVERGYRLPSDFEPVEISVDTGNDYGGDIDPISPTPVSLKITPRTRTSDSDKTEINEEMVSSRRNRGDYDPFSHLDKVHTSYGIRGAEEIVGGVNDGQMSTDDSWMERVKFDVDKSTQLESQNNTSEQIDDSSMHYVNKYRDSTNSDNIVSSTKQDIPQTNGDITKHSKDMPQSNDGVADDSEFSESFITTKEASIEQKPYTGASFTAVEGETHVFKLHRKRSAGSNDTGDSADESTPSKHERRVSEGELVTTGMDEKGLESNAVEHRDNDMGPVSSERLTHHLYMSSQEDQTAPTAVPQNVSLSYMFPDQLPDRATLSDYTFQGDSRDQSAQYSGASTNMSQDQFVADTNNKPNSDNFNNDGMVTDDMTGSETEQKQWSISFPSTQEHGIKVTPEPSWSQELKYQSEEGIDVKNNELETDFATDRVIPEESKTQYSKNIDFLSQLIDKDSNMSSGEALNTIDESEDTSSNDFAMGSEKRDLNIHTTPALNGTEFSNLVVSGEKDSAFDIEWREKGDKIISPDGQTQFASKDVDYLSDLLDMDSKMSSGAGSNKTEESKDISSKDAEMDSANTTAESKDTGSKDLEMGGGDKTQDSLKTSGINDNRVSNVTGAEGGGSTIYTGGKDQNLAKTDSDVSPLINSRDDAVSIGRESLDSGRYSIDQEQTDDNRDSSKMFSSFKKLRGKKEEEPEAQEGEEMQKTEIQINIGGGSSEAKNDNQEVDRKTTELRDGEALANMENPSMTVTGNSAVGGDVMMVIGDRKADEKEGETSATEQQQGEKSDDQAQLSSSETTGKPKSDKEKSPLIKKGKKKESKIRDTGPGCLCCTIV